MQITVDYARSQGAFEHFWCSTGFSPAELLFDDDMQQALTYIGAVPYGGIQHVRIHYLLNLLTVAGSGYDWSRLDAAIDLLVQNNLKPFFELMGNPSDSFDNYEDAGQLHRWRDLVEELARRYSARYGAEAVRAWYFETWNEPDIPFWTHSEAAFCNYYDACSEGLKAADPALRFGGPGTARTLSPLFKAILAHCDTGVNFFTGETGVRLDFISYHEKGQTMSVEDIDPDMAGMVEREAHILDYIRTHHPRLRDVPVMNNECDPQVGWWHIHTWHARPYYPALVAKMIDQHLVRLVDAHACNYGLLGSDHGFLGRWGQRTLLARFGERELPTGQIGHRTTLNDAAPMGFEMVKKPILSGMTMLALLGDERLTIEERLGGDLGILATRRGDSQIALLVYHSRDQIMSSGSEAVALRLENLPFSQLMLAHYRLDANHGDPFALWAALGAPENPSAEQLDDLRRQAELPLMQPLAQMSVSNGVLELAFDLPLPALSLILLTAPTDALPETPANLRARVYAGLTERENVLLAWDAGSARTVRTFEVLYRPTGSSEFSRINPVDVRDGCYLHARTAGATGEYRVQAVDFWDRAGAESAVLRV